MGHTAWVPEGREGRYQATYVEILQGVSKKTLFNEIGTQGA